MTKSALFTVQDPVYTHLFPEPFAVGEERVDEVPFRKPTGLDLLEVGTPVVYDTDTGKADLDIPRCYEMTARLSGYPRRAFLAVDPGEMLDLFWLLASFFMKGRQAQLPALEKLKAARVARAASPESSLENTTQDSP